MIGSRSDRVTAFDEAVPYAAMALALGATLMVAGAGSGSLLIGSEGSMLVAAGTLVSWRMRHRPRSGVLLGAPLGLAAGAGFLLLVARELAAEESHLFMVQSEVGLLLALRMATLPLVLSFVMVKYDVMAFALVPALATFGLVGGQGDSTVVWLCFAAFLPSALVALGHSMVLSGLLPGRSFPGRLGSSLGGPVVPGTGGRLEGGGWRLGAWRARHWAGLGISIGLIGVLTYVLFYPIAIGLSQYRWRLLARVTSAPGMLLPQPRRSPRNLTTFPVGRGRPPLSKDPVLTVARLPAGPEAPHPYWRGQAFDLYSGQAWLRSEESLALVAENSRNREEEESESIEPRPMRPAPLIEERVVDLSQTFPGPPTAHLEAYLARAETDLRPLLFFSPGLIQQLIRPERGSPGDPFPEMGLRVDDYGCVEAQGQEMPRGFTYQVVAAPMEARGRRPAASEGQRNEQELGMDPLSPFSSQLSYLKIPFGARRVADLARRIAGDEPTAERKLAALTAYLQQHCVYTLDAPPTPRGRDAADYFLFSSRRGHCDLFATALAVMARAVGIPTRLVTGYAFPSPAEPAGGAAWVFRECDAHAWVEAYVLPWGWVSADATPVGEGSPIPALRRSWLALRFTCQDHPFLAATGALVLLTIAAIGATRVWRLRRPSLTRRGQRGASPRDARGLVMRAYAQLLHLLRRRGRQRRPSQTPLEFLSDLENAHPRPGALVQAGPQGRSPWLQAALPAISSLTALFVAARYGPGPITPEIADQAQQHLAAAREQMRRGTVGPPGPIPGN